MEIVYLALQDCAFKTMILQEKRRLWKLCYWVDLSRYRSPECSGVENFQIGP